MLMMWWARWSIWIVGCALATAVVIGNAFYQKKQFYPTVVYITKSKPSMAVMYAQALLFVVMLGKLFRKLFFGQLRTAEFEHLVERSWYAVTETCLAFTVFRDDFSPKFLALFTLLLFLKSFHWLAEERVDYMERSPVITWVFHIRVLSLLSILFLTDVYFVNVAYQSTITKGASVQLVFGFEYAILTTIVLNTVAKYVFHVVDMQNETPWENKAVFVLHTEVVIGFFKVILYVVFVMIMVRVYTLPLFALRPTYLALRAFKKAVNDVIMSRRAINNMNNLYPDVTLEELAATDNVCIICREEMTGGAKKLPCNHIFHVSCLRSWFQRQQTCPTCRLNVLRVPVPPTAAAPAAAGGQNFGAFMVNQFPGFGGAGLFRAAGQPQQQQPQQQQQQQPGGPFAGMWGNIMPQQWAQQVAAAQQQHQQQQQAAAAGGVDPTVQQQQQAGGDAQNANQNQGDAAAGMNFGPRGPFPNQIPMFAGAAGGPPMMVPPPPPQFAFRQPAGSTGPNITRPTNAGDFMSAGPSGFNFPMPYIPFVPPPPPLLQTTGLTDDELRVMEGNTRESIEARLRSLRNVQILLDSAVVQMQQYSAIASHYIVTPTPATTTTSASTAEEEPVQGTSGNSVGNSSASTSKTSPPSEEPLLSKSSPPAPSPLLVDDKTIPNANGAVMKDITTTTTSPETSSVSTSTTSPSSSLSASVEQDELRKRRLARFNQTTTAGTGEGGTGE